MKPISLISLRFTAKKRRNILNINNLHRKCSNFHFTPKRGGEGGVCFRLGNWVKRSLKAFSFNGARVRVLLPGHEFVGGNDAARSPRQRCVSRSRSLNDRREKSLPACDGGCAREKSRRHSPRKREGYESRRRKRPLGGDARSLA